MNRQQRRMKLQRLLNATSIKATVNTRGSLDNIKAEAGNIQRLEIIAYTGGQIYLEGFSYPIVIDLASTVIAPNVPLLWSHDRDIVLGQVPELKISGSTVVGVAALTGVNQRAEEVRASSSNGHKWNVSAGTQSDDMELVAEGQKRTINGQSFIGPFYHAKNNTVREVSILSIGADENAFAVLLAASHKGLIMKTFAEFLASLQIDESKLSEAEKLIAKKMFDNMNVLAKEGDKTVPTPTIDKSGNQVPTVVVPDATTLAANAADYIKRIREGAAIEEGRIDKIKSISSKYSNPTILVAGAKTNLIAHAIKEGWSEEKTELEAMRNARPTNINAGGRNASSGDTPQDSYMILAAALAVQSKTKNLDKLYTPQVLDAAHKEYKGRIGLQQFLLEAAAIGGYTGKANFKSNMRAILQAAFSTIDIPTMLADQVNKMLWEGFTSVDDSWRLLAKIGSVPDFKETNGYRGVGSFRFEDVAPDGHIPHGTMSETGYGNKATTKAKMLGITRVDMINDDLGVLTSVPRGLGRGGILALVHSFWTEFMDNSTFFAAGNNNVTTGALGLAGLATAVAKFSKQTDEQGDYVMAMPKYLVMPTELEPTAMDLYTQTNLVGGSTVAFGENRYRGRYQPISSPYLSDSRFTGNSTTAYYLIADPNDIPVIEVVFLDGVEQPTVETADVDFDQLGIQMRGYFDYGVRKQEFRGGVRSTGV